MTGISSHVFKLGWTTTRVSEHNRVGEFKRDGLLHDSV